MIAGIERVRQALPPSIALRQVLDAIEALAADSCEPFQRAAMRLLAAMAASHPPLARVRFVEHARLASMNGELKVGWLWEAMAAELSRAVPERLLGPWSRRARGDAAFVAGRPDPRRRLAAAGRYPALRSAALARLARDVPVTIEHARRIGAALAGGLDIEQSVALATQLDPFELHLDATLVRAAVALLGRDVPALVAPLRALHSLCDESGADVEDAVAALFEHAAATGGGWLLRGLLARNAGAVIELAQLARWAARASWPKLPAPVRPAWIAAYPAALEGALSRLAAADPDAEATARRRIAAVLARSPRRPSARPPRCARAPRSARARPGGCRTWRRASPRPGRRRARSSRAWRRSWTRRRWTRARRDSRPP